MFRTLSLKCRSRLLIRSIGLIGLFLASATAYSQTSTNNIATNAIASTSYVSPWENLLAIQNGRDPVSSTDKTGGAYGNWPNTTWPLGARVDRIAVYWWTDNGGIMAPSACWLDYWTGSNYVSVPNPVG